MIATSRTLLVLVALLPLANAGCAMTNTDRGILTGGGLGAAAGALVGGQRGNAGPGALIGGALGAVAGGLTGAAVDNVERRNAERADSVRRAMLTPAQIIHMVQSGVGDEVIITQIRATRSAYALSAEDIISLRTSGVSEAVIGAMQQTMSRPVYIAAPPEPVYVIHPVPPPCPVGFGFTYIRR